MEKERKIRVLVAKPGLDGHDRGAKIIARALRDAGMEVIYTGIRQTPPMIVEAAIQEDVDAVLMSILSGAHLAIFPKVMQMLADNGVDDVLVMAGGILPDEDIPAIERLGIKGNFGPGTSMSTIIDFVRANINQERLKQELAPLRQSTDRAAGDMAARNVPRSGGEVACRHNPLLSDLLAGDRRALARVVTLIESNAPETRSILAQLHSYGGHAHIVGLTGSPGAGKSTLVMQLGRELRRRGKRIGVVAVDPSSPFTGGAILGDRIRMQELAGDPNVFIRSMASRGSLGGLARATRDVVRALDAAGFDTILIETVGAGQAEVEIVRAAQSVIVVTVPGMGDDIQAIKAGILEIADIFVVNKADRPGADQTAAELRMLMSLDERRKEHVWRVPIVKTSASTGEGIAELADKLDEHLASLRETGQLAARHGHQARSEMLALLHQALLEKLEATLTPEDWDQLVDEVVERHLDPYTAAEEIARRIGLSPEESKPI